MNRQSTKMQLVNTVRDRKTVQGPMIRNDTGRLSVRQRRALLARLGLPGLLTQGELGEWPLIQTPVEVQARYCVVRKGACDQHYSDLYFVPLETAKAWIQQDGAVLPRLMVSPARRDEIGASKQGHRIKALGWELIALPPDQVDKVADWFPAFEELVELQLNVERSGQ